MRLRPPRQLDSYTVFLSSGDDAAKLRRRVKKLVEDAFNPQLLEAQSPFTIRLDMWERHAAQRALPGESVNDLFLDRARKADVLLVLLLDKLGTGTQEEVEAVLDSDVQLSVLHFTKKTEAQLRRTKVGRFVREHRDKMLYERRYCGPDSEGTWIAIVKTVLAVLLGGVAQERDREPLIETR